MLLFQIMIFHTFSFRTEFRALKFSEKKLNKLHQKGERCSVCTMGSQNSSQLPDDIPVASQFQVAARPSPSQFPSLLPPSHPTFLLLPEGHQGERLLRSQSARKPSPQIGLAMDENCGTVQIVPVLCFKHNPYAKAIHSEMVRTLTKTAGRPRNNRNSFCLIPILEPERYYETDVSKEPYTKPAYTRTTYSLLKAVSGVKARQMRMERQTVRDLVSVYCSWICSEQIEKHHMLSEKVRSHLRTVTLCSEQNNRGLVLSLLVDFHR